MIQRGLQCIELGRVLHEHRLPQLFEKQRPVQTGDSRGDARSVVRALSLGARWDMYSSSGHHNTAALDAHMQLYRIGRAHRATVSSIIPTLGTTAAGLNTRV